MHAFKFWKAEDSETFSNSVSYSRYRKVQKSLVSGKSVAQP